GEEADHHRQDHDGYGLEDLPPEVDGGADDQQPPRDRGRLTQPFGYVVFQFGPPCGAGQGTSGGDESPCSAPGFTDSVGVVHAFAWVGEGPPRLGAHESGRVVRESAWRSFLLATPTRGAPFRQPADVSRPEPA